jgi:hypothetical protein
MHMPLPAPPSMHGSVLAWGVQSSSLPGLSICLCHSMALGRTLAAVPMNIYTTQRPDNLNPNPNLKTQNTASQPVLNRLQFLCHDVESGAVGRGLCPAPLQHADLGIQTCLHVHMREKVGRWGGRANPVIFRTEYMLRAFPSMQIKTSMLVPVRPCLLLPPANPAVSGPGRACRGGMGRRLPSSSALMICSGWREEGRGRGG